MMRMGGWERDKKQKEPARDDILAWVVFFPPRMKFKLTDFTGIIRMESFSIPVVVHNTKRDQIDVVIYIRNMRNYAERYLPSFIKEIYGLFP